MKQKRTIFAHVDIGQFGRASSRLIGVLTILVNFSRPFGIDHSVSSVLNLKNIGWSKSPRKFKERSRYISYFWTEEGLLLGRPSPKRAAAAAGPREGEY